MTPEDQRDVNAVRIGMLVLDFLDSELYQIVKTRNDQDAINAFKSFIKADLSDTKALINLQVKARVASLFNEYLDGILDEMMIARAEAQMRETEEMGD